VSGVVVLAAVNDLAISEDFYSSLYAIEYAWLAVVIFVGLQRSRQLIEAAATRRPWWNRSGPSDMRPPP